MSKKIILGVLFRNNVDLIEPFFWCLRQSIIDIDLTVYVLDNGSKDGTFEKLVTSKYINESKDIIIPSENNLGIAKGRNRILEEVKANNNNNYQDIIFIDSDVLITNKGSIEYLNNSSINKPHIGMIFAKINSFWKYSDEGFGICFCLVKKEVFEKIGIFNPEFELYYDDSDFMSRMELANYKYQISNEARGIHFWGTTCTQGSEKYRREECLKKDKELFTKLYPKHKLPEEF